MTITQANSFVGAIHDRMPVLLDQEGAAAWLSGEAGLELLKPAPDDALRMLAPGHARPLPASNWVIPEVSSTVPALSSAQNCRYHVPIPPLS